MIISGKAASIQIIAALIEPIFLLGASIFSLKARKSMLRAVVIAHRISTVVNADTIVVLENGQILEQGSHDDLYTAKDRYYQMWKKQTPVNFMVGQPHQKFL